MTKTKKVKVTGKFGVRYGTKVKEKLKPIEAKQRKKQICPFCKRKKLKRISSGIWVCKRCGKKFASDAYYLS
jgi:large subunit ribosomal protein L37Ae